MLRIGDAIWMLNEMARGGPPTLCRQAADVNTDDLYDLSDPIYLLQYLRRRSRVPMSQIAAEMCVPISTASRLADRLQRRGLISRARDAADRRRVLVSLRPRGRELVRKVERHSFARLTTNLQGVPAESVAALLLAARLLPAALEVTGEGSSR